MYKITKEIKRVENEERMVYGIYYNDEYNVSDITVNRAATEKLVEDCNKYQLAPIHLYDVIEDFLNG